MEVSQVFFAVAAEKFYISERLGTRVFNGETAIVVLCVVRSSDNVISNFEKIYCISTVWTSDEVGYLRLF